jgi:hypothetical protein
VEGFCEHGNEPSGSINCWEILEWLGHGQRGKVGAAPRRCVFSYNGKFSVIPLTAWSRVPLEKPPVAQLLKNLPTFYGTRRFTAVFKRGPPPPTGP